MKKSISILTIIVTLALASGLAAVPYHAGASEPVPSAPETEPSVEEPLAIIINNSNPITNLSFAELRNIFLAEREHWPHGKKITLVMREPDQPERQAVLQLICRMSEGDFKRHFLHTNFTGNMQPAPKLLSTGAGVRRFVFNVAGAIGYVRASEVDASVKAIRIDGRAPGESGYRIKLAPR